MKPLHKKSIECVIEWIKCSSLELNMEFMLTEVFFRMWMLLFTSCYLPLETLFEWLHEIWFISVSCSVSFNIPSDDRSCLFCVITSSKAEEMMIGWGYSSLMPKWHFLFEFLDHFDRILMEFGSWDLRIDIKINRWIYITVNQALSLCWDFLQLYTLRCCQTRCTEPRSHTKF